jgi:uncharacterized coiled-coil protein SlyX
MSQSFWESEVESETQSEQTASQPEQPDAQVAPLAAEPVRAAAELERPEQPAAQPTVEASGALALSVDDFSALEERILRAVNLVKRERLARAAAEERASMAEFQLSEQAPLVENLQKEVSSLHAERDHVRQRVERLLSQLDALEL